MNWVWRSFIFLFATNAITSAVKINRINVPSLTELGKTDFVILDCEYEISEEEKGQLDVKWYFNDDPVPFYFWIPGWKLQLVFGTPFENSVDLSESHVDEKFRTPQNEHRAVKIVRPDLIHSGKYSCKASTFIDEEVQNSNMTVYAPPIEYNLDVEADEEDDNLINIFCRFKRVYPKPLVELTWASRDGMIKGDVDETNQYFYPNEKVPQSFDVEIIHQISVENITEDVDFWCSLEIPEVDLKVEQTAIHVFIEAELSSSGEEEPEAESGSGESGSGEENSEDENSGEKILLTDKDGSPSIGITDEILPTNPLEPDPDYELVNDEYFQDTQINAQQLTEVMDTDAGSTRYPILKIVSVAVFLSFISN